MRERALEDYTYTMEARRKARVEPRRVEPRRVVRGAQTPTPCPLPSSAGIITPSEAVPARGAMLARVEAITTSLWSPLGCMK